MKVPRLSWFFLRIRLIQHGFVGRGSLVMRKMAVSFIALPALIALLIAGSLAPWARSSTHGTKIPSVPWPVSPAAIVILACLLAEMRRRRRALRQGSKNRPRISVIIPSWNTVDLLKVCIECVRVHTPDPLEIIVVDNGSTDGSRDILRHLESASIRPILLPVNQGFASACNHGLRAATGDILCLLNTDAFVTRGWSQSILSRMRKTGAGMAGPWTNAAKGPQRRKWRHRMIPPMFRRPLEVDFLSFFCVVMTRDVLSQVGWLDEQFGLGSFEDDDYCRRARKLGFRLVIDPRSWVWHAAHRTMMANDLDIKELTNQGKKVFEAKWGMEEVNQKTDHG